MRSIGLSFSILAISALGVTGHRPAGAQDDAYEAFLRDQNTALDRFQQGETRAFTAFLRADSLAFAEFKAEVERRWDRFVEPEARTWIEYDSDLDARSTVDFEQGEARVEVIAPESTSHEALAGRLRAKIEQVASSRGTTDDFAGRATDPALGSPAPLSERPILEGQIAGASGVAVSTTEVKRFADRQVNEGKMRSSTFTGRDGVARVKLTIVLPLVPDHLRRRAERYLPTVREQSSSVARRKDVAAMPIELVLAIMQTESFFNPKARSHVPAFGLMQLVPNSGAKDALQYLGEEERVLSGEALYVPPRNIELGIAYVSKLWHQYYRGIKDPVCRQYCVIAAYNTGPGNVNRTLNTGSSGVSKSQRGRFGPAVARVNREFTGRGDELKAHLLEHLPHDETKGYLTKVSERMGNYAEWSRPDPAS
ncbi:MAG: hypothetical protein CME06_08370 [Gemmatimonadetes bacterium]|nr:hypothetical protein [Gemmatimonadota bacterium]